MGQFWRPAGTGGIPRGIATDGWPLFSYGFRPFFLGAGLFALVAMPLWLGALVWGWPVGGAAYGPVRWHAHEMLFGYTTAALAGFLLTTIPNWTGRLPVSGAPLAGLAALWAAGRLAMAAPDVLGQLASAGIDSAFLLVVLFVAAREIVAGRNWKNLKIVVALSLLAGLNIAFHVSVGGQGDAALFERAAIAVYISLIGLVGGRIIPSFTRNWLARVGAARLPAPFDRFDLAAMILLPLAMGVWALDPDWVGVAPLAAITAIAHLVRLLRWQGIAARAEPMLVVLHVGYAFIPLGLVALAGASLGVIAAVSALHLLTVGAIVNMTLAVMTRATRGHTGRPILATKPTLLIFVAIFLSAAIRPFAELVPDSYLLVLGTSGAAWMLAFLLFSIEYGTMLVQARVPGVPKRPSAAPVSAAGTPAASEPERERLR